MAKFPKAETKFFPAVNDYEHPYQTGDAAADARRYRHGQEVLRTLDEIEQMAPDALVAKYLAADAAHEIYNPDDPFDHLSEAIDLLPERNIEAARRALPSFANHQSTEARWAATLLVMHVAFYDSEYALPFWDRLIRDSEDKVRDAAKESLDSVASGYPEEDQLPALTWRDAYRLLDAYLEAEEHDYRVHDVSADSSLQSPDSA